MMCNQSLLYGMKILEGSHGGTEGTGKTTGTKTITITLVELFLAGTLEMLHID